MKSHFGPINRNNPRIGKNQFIQSLILFEQIFTSPQMLINDHFCSSPLTKEPFSPFLKKQLFSKET